MNKRLGGLSDMARIAGAAMAFFLAVQGASACFECVTLSPCPKSCPVGSCTQKKCNAGGGQTCKCENLGGTCECFAG